VIPSGEVAATVVGPPATATNTPLPKVTEDQLREDGSVLAVHVMPSGEVAAAVPLATTTKTPLPKSPPVQLDEDGKVLAVAAYVTGVITGTIKAPSAV